MMEGQWPKQKCLLTAVSFSPYRYFLTGRIFTSFHFTQLNVLVDKDTVSKLCLFVPGQKQISGTSK